jgi:hypothetical protein
MNDINIDLVSTKYSNYRGIERPLTTNEILENNSCKDFDFLLDCYYNYIDITYNQELDTNELYNKYYKIFVTFRESDVPCEIIFFTENPIFEFNGIKLEFLGCDIINHNKESLLTDSEIEIVSNYLNNNGLCSNISNVETVKKIFSSRLSCFQWKPYYVYRVVN